MDFCPLITKGPGFEVVVRRLAAGLPTLRSSLGGLVDGYDAIIGAVRDAVGNAVDLLIEGHGRFNVPTACTIARELEPFRPLFFEEPVQPGAADPFDQRTEDQVTQVGIERLSPCGRRRQYGDLIDALLDRRAP